MRSNYHIDRRRFLQSSGLATTAMLVPNFLKGFEKESQAVGNGKKLVIIQLSGGNDGLNTVVPVRNDIYYRSRPTIALSKTTTINVEDDIGLHPDMAALAALYEQGLVSIISQVGYPNPNRSHFRSMDIWHTASSAEEILSTGWLGRYLDAACSGAAGCAHHALEIDDTLSLALKGEHVKALAFSDADKLYKAISSDYYRQVLSLHAAGQENEPLEYLYKTLAETASSAAYLVEKNTIYGPKQEYPQGRFGRSLKTIAGLIGSGVESRVYYASISGFDTHANQLNIQSRMLKQVSEGIGALVKDLQASNMFSETLIVVFSEFGRRVEQNASNGTDHGAANSMFIIGDKLKKPGMFNGGPDLSELIEGDLPHKIDFRQAYATLLKNWLGADDNVVLGNSFAPLNLV